MILIYLNAQLSRDEHREAEESKRDCILLNKTYLIQTRKLSVLKNETQIIFQSIAT